MGNFFRMKKGRAGFTLIELLIVVAILGIIAAMLIPSMIEALHKSRQKRTMGSLREFGIGVAAYWTDTGGAAAAGAATSVAVSEWQGAATLSELSTALVPDYIPVLPDTDGWGHALEYRVSLNQPPRAQYALVRAPSRDGSYQGDSYSVGPFVPSDYDQDIVWADGGFIRAPDSAAVSPPGGGTP